jgi:hypothetical protein
MRAITTTIAILLTLSLANAAAAFDGIFIPEIYEGPFCLAWGPEPERFVFASAATGDVIEFEPHQIRHSGDCSFGNVICDEYTIEASQGDVPDASYDAIYGTLAPWQGATMYYWGDYAAGRDWLPADQPELENPDFNAVGHMLYKESVPGFLYNATHGAYNDVMRWYVDAGVCFYMVVVKMHVH